MISLRKARDRGHVDHGWLQSWHSFSFATYRDPNHNQFGPLRVINEDFIAPGMGFGMHPHRDMEIISYVLDGELEHRDNMGNSSIIIPGNVQRMSAGTGVLHSEYNPSPTHTSHLLQIWILPEENGIPPSYEEYTFPTAAKRGQLCLIAAPAKHSSNAVTLHQDAYVYAGLLNGTEEISHPHSPSRKLYIHLARGELLANGYTLHAGDALRMEGEQFLHLYSGNNAEVLVFDLP